MSQRPKKVFICTDTFNYTRDYYVVVGPECDSYDAEVAAENEPCPEYINGDEPGEYGGLCDVNYLL